MGRPWGKFAAVAAIAMAICAAAAAPAGAVGEPETGGAGAFRLEGSNGYRLLVLASSRPDYRQGELRVFVVGRKDFVGYRAPATVTDTRIEADLGVVGRIDLEFEPSGATKMARSSCEPKHAFPYQPGAYVGTVEIRGEEDYTEAAATRVPLFISPFVDFGCSMSSYGELFGDGVVGARLTAQAPLRSGSVFLRGNQNRPGAPLRLWASIEEERGEVEIQRELGAVYPGNAFRFHPQLRTAALRPPGPYSGSAVFRRHAKPSNRWTGNLEVDFPGRSNVSLTGDRFRVGLLHATYVSRALRSERPRRPSPFALPSLSRLPLAAARSWLLGR